MLTRLSVVHGTATENTEWHWHVVNTPDSCSSVLHFTYHRSKPKTCLDQIEYVSRAWAERKREKQWTEAEALDLEIKWTERSGERESEKITPRKPWLQLRFDYDTTTIRRYYDAFDYDGSDRNYNPTTTYRVRLLPFDAIRREQKMNMSVFRRSRIVVVSWSNRNCDIGLRVITRWLSLYAVVWFISVGNWKTSCKELQQGRRNAGWVWSTLH